MNSGELRKGLIYIRSDSLENFASDFRDWAEQALHYMEDLEGDIEAAVEKVGDRNNGVYDVEKRVDKLDSKLVDIEAKLETLEESIDNLEEVDSADAEDDQDVIHGISPEVIQRLSKEVGKLRNEIDNIPFGSDIEDREDFLDLTDKLEGLSELVEKRHGKSQERLEGIEWAIREDNEAIITALQDTRSAVTRIVKAIREIRQDIKNLREGVEELNKTRKGEEAIC